MAKFHAALSERNVFLWHFHAARLSHHTLSNSAVERPRAGCGTSHKSVRQCAQYRTRGLDF